MATPKPTPEELQKQKEAAIQTFLATYSSLTRIKIKIFPPDATFASLLSFLPLDHSKCHLGFDFDQTLKIIDPTEGISVRGGKLSYTTLDDLYSSGATFCVISAQEPTLLVIQNLKKELEKIELAKHFDVEPFPTEKVKELIYLKFNKPITELNLRQLMEKLILFWLMNTQRYARDLHRLAFSTIRFVEDVGMYKLYPQTGTTPSAEQKLEDLPTSACLKEYYERTKDLKRSNDRLFIKLDKENNPVKMAESDEVASLEPDDIVQIVKDVIIKEFNQTEEVCNKVIEEKIKEIKLMKEGVKICYEGHAIASRYNKPEAFEWWLSEINKLDLETNAEKRTFVFIDDNSDNVFNVYMKFAEKVREQVTALRSNWELYCIWFTPPLSGKSEEFDEVSRELLTKLAST